MRSDRWEDTALSLARIAAYRVDNFEDPHLQKSDQEAVEKARERGPLVILELDRTDGP